jgi:hypothetical protein
MPVWLWVAALAVARPRRTGSLPAGPGPVVASRQDRHTVNYATSGLWYCLGRDWAGYKHNSPSGCRTVRSGLPATREAVPCQRHPDLPLGRTRNPLIIFV